MATGFVWFHNGTENAPKAAGFYQDMFGWKAADGPPGMRMFMGDEGPFAAVGERQGGAAGWIPYVQVDDLDAAVPKAEAMGARVMQAKTAGPAGQFAILRDPGGAALGLWQEA